jgi:predicted dehydrogenase
MKTDGSLKRREFLKTGLATGGALAGAPAILAQRNPNDRIGVAAVGVGTRGHYLMRQAQGVANTEIRVICDLYEGNLKRAKEFCTNTGARTTSEWERAVADPDVDAVIIATPDFWHAPMTIRAAEAKKHIYVEKGWCTKLEDAKKMRRAIKENNVVMQLGHHYNSLPTFHRARQIFQSGELGKAPLVRTYIDRTSALPEWQFYTNYNVREMPKDASPQTIDWNRFVANAPKRPFDPQRFFMWRCWWDYSTGIAGDLMSHLWDSVNMVMGMGIPETAVTQGGNYFWKGDREVPDMWHVLFDYPKKELAITFACSFHNRHVGEVEQFLGRDKTLEVSPGFCRTYIAEWKPEHTERAAQARKAAAAAGRDPQEAETPPDYVFKKGELEVTDHMQNFLDCIRTGERPRCDVDRAFEEAATILMSVEAFRRERKVRWDSVREEIV